eukprot:c15270_g1_i1.p1 GENE.c15270_g1_i1~~c15270_g1_i1.p1  ORF type:complete len:193 (-),score=45.89 c15270_g1_i1:255-833(-)
MGNDRCFVGGMWRFAQSTPSRLPAYTRGLKTSPTFDTHLVVRHLRAGGFDDKQSEVILEVLTSALEESLKVHAETFTTKAETLTVRAELNEKVFNSTLKAESHQRHQRDILERDFKALKHEIIASEKADFAIIERRLVEFEKAMMQQKARTDEDLGHVRSQVQMVEARSVKFSVGLIGTVTALAVAVARLML